MDWTLTGALGGLAIVAITAGYELSMIARSSTETAKQQAATPALIPTLERSLDRANPSTSAAGFTLSSNTPAITSAPVPPPAEAPPVSETALSPRHASRGEAPPPVTSRPKEQHSPPPDSPVSAYKEAKLPPPPPKPPISSDLWLVRTTAKASYFNLGGHVDKEGIVDGLASGYLRSALMKHKNFTKLPAQIQTYITAPSINLAKIAGYRTLLGIDDKEMEEKQGVKFIKIAGSRSIVMTGPGAAELDAVPIDLGLLERMDFDLRFGMALGFAP